MKFLPGDAYIYESIAGHSQRILIRSNDDRWASVPDVSDGKYVIFDDEIQKCINIAAGAGRLREVFIRRGIDILDDAMLGYADNIQF